MSVATMEPVVEAEVLTALDFDTPPVEVTEPKVAEPVIWFTDPNAKFTITWDPVEKPVVDDEVPSFKTIEGKVAAQFAEMFKGVMATCNCSLCVRPHVGPMDPQAKRAWVTALRSRRFPQGRGALRQGDRRCALGVLVEVAIEAGVQVTTSVDAANNTGYDGQFGSLPVAVQKWAGLRSGDPYVQGCPVAALNDRGTPFVMLADMIEAGL